MDLFYGYKGARMAFQLVAIEDEPEIAELLRVVLTSPSVELSFAATGNEGLALIRQVRPDLAILDVMLPGELDGWDVFDTLRADPAFASLPVLMLTVQRHPAERAHLFADDGINQYLTKPFDPLVLRDRIERMLGQRDLWRKPSMSVRSVLGVLNQAAEALDLDRRVDLAEPGDPETELR